MASCKYILKGHTFNSEIELDDFLLSRGRLMSRLGDAVFSMSDKMSETCDIIYNGIIKDSKKLAKAYLEFKERTHYLGETEIEELLKPYIGVNKFLSMVKIDDIRLFPEFIEENYWENRTKQWKVGNFTDEEIELLFPEGNILPITDSSIIENSKRLIRSKWNLLGAIGLCIHTIMLEYFNNPSITEEQLKNKLTTFIDKSINNESRLKAGNPKYTYEDLIPKDSIITDALDIAKRLDSQLKARFGNDIKYFTEISISSKLNLEMEDGTDTILGIIDLLVVDSKGRAHVIDYKTSPKNYNTSEYNSVKKRTFRHLLCAYNKLLATYGLNNPENTMMVVPILMMDFKPSEEGNKYTYSSLIPNISSDIYSDITGSIKGTDIERNVSEFINVPLIPSFTTENALLHITDIESHWMPGYKSLRTLDDEELRKELDEAGCFTPNEDGNLVYDKWVAKPIIVKADTPDAEVKLFNLVKKSREQLLNSRQSLTLYTRSIIKECLEDPSKIDLLRQTKKGTSYVDPEWFKHKLLKYCERDTWKILDLPLFEILEHFGMIALQNKNTGIVDIVKISPSTLDRKFELGKGRSTLIGAFDTDVNLMAKLNAKVLEAVYGNIELMEAMLVLNEMNGMFDSGMILGNVLVANPYLGYGMQASPEEMLYNFNELDKFYATPTNYFKTGHIKVASNYELCALRFGDILREGSLSNWEKHSEFLNFSDGKTSNILTDFIASNDNRDKIKALQELAEDIENHEQWQVTLSKVQTDTRISSEDYVELYNMIMTTIAELNNVNLRQLIRDHDLFLSSARIFKNGISGTYIDNPGNLNSETLNTITKLVTEAYQNVRVEMLEPTAKIGELVKSLLKRYSYNRFTGIPGRLYENLYRASDADLILKNVNDSSLLPEEREFIKETLYMINKLRFPKLTDELLKNKELNDDLDYYRVPIAEGKRAGAESKGIWKSLKLTLNKFTLDHIKRSINKSIDNFDSNNQNENGVLDLYKMTSSFDRGDGNDRKQLILEMGGVDNLQKDLEEVFLSYTFSHSVKENINSVFPLIKACSIHIAALGSNMNKVWEYDLKYIEDYINSAVKNKNIMDPQFLKLAKITTPLKKAATICTLGLSPVLFLYLTIQGLWNDISLIIRKPDGTDAFSFHNMKDAFTLVYKDLFVLADYRQKPTICSRLNELYGLNDMDMNSLVNKLKSDQHGIRNWENFFMRFSSRPDYYNRLTIFGALMRADGCWDAHSLDSLGKLRYDWTKDSRFNLLANPANASNPEYNKLKSLYITMAKLFVKEGAKYDNGELFVFDPTCTKPLPRAYCTILSESMKEIADNVYGYYSHEKKSLIHSTFIGTMWMQFRTYWSGKKNQYFGTGGIKLRGKWKTVEGYCYDENGIVTKINEDGSNDTGIPFQVWEGDWQEGIMITLSDLIKEGWTSKSITQAWKSLFNLEDEKMARIYRNNWKQLLIDMTMWIVIGSLAAALMGDWLKELKEEKKGGDTLDGLLVAAALIAYKSVILSFSDFNFMDSLGSPLASWTPVSLEWSRKTLLNVAKIATGDKDFVEGVMNITSVGRLLMPIVDTLKPEE